MSDAKPHLSQELIDSIISFAWDGSYGKQAIATCALVQRSWVPTSRSRLFKSVDLRAEKREAWLRLLNSSDATFPKYVNCIDATLFHFDGRSFSKALPYIAHPRLVNVETLKLSNITVDADISDSESLGALRNTIQHLKIYDLGIVEANPLAFLSQFPSLAKLDLYIVNQRNPAPLKVTYKAPSSLRALVLGFVRDKNLLHDLLNWTLESSPQLTELSLDSNDGRLIKPITKLLQRGCKTLTKLRLNLSSSQELQSLLATCNLPALRALYLDVDANFHSVTWLQECLASIQPPCIEDGYKGLELLVFGLDSSASEEIDNAAQERVERDEEDDEILWKDLDVALQQPQFSGLKELVFMLQVPFGDEVMDYVYERCLPECNKRQIISLISTDSMSEPESWGEIPW